MNEKVMVIDDEAQIRRLLCIALRSEGYQVFDADNAQNGIDAVARQQPDLVILDLGLPDKEGHEVLATIRQWSAVPIIVLSVRSSEKEKIKALDNGAQDYVTKPFSVQELLARVRANLRDRSQQATVAKLDDGHLLIDVGRRQVTLAQHAVELTPKEYAVLSRLAAVPNCVVTQSQLLQEIWGKYHENDTHYLRIVISHLRQKLGDDPAEPRYLRTEPGVGYRLIFDEQAL